MAPKKDLASAKGKAKAKGRPKAALLPSGGKAKAKAKAVATGKAKAAASNKASNKASPKSVAVGRLAKGAAAKAKAKAKAGSKAAPKAKAGAKSAASGAATKRAAGSSPPPPAAKKGRKGETSPAASSAGRPADAAKAKAGAKGSAGPRKVDSRCPQPGLTVHENYTVTLNQTNIGGNNNKFYIIQVLAGGGKFYSWNRWGRVGEPGQNKLQPAPNADAAIKDFESKFHDKTKNRWENRDSFEKVAGKYMLVETEDSAGGTEDAPMGKLTEAQIHKGEAVLEKLTTALKKSKDNDINELSSQFFTIIPTDFGRKKPVPITTMDMLGEKLELLKFFLRMGFEQMETEDNLAPIDGLLDLACPKSLDEAAAGLCSKAEVNQSKAQGKELCARKAGKPKGDMPDSMYAAIMLYTSNAIYAALNKALRDKNRTAIKKYFKYLRLLLAAMDALPQKKNTLWRGLSIDLSDDPQYAPGKTVTWWGVSSCTSNLGVAKGFAESCGGGASVCTLHTKTACDISEISFFSGEKESLLRPGTQLKVKSRAKKGGITNLVLEEVGQSIK